MSDNAGRKTARRRDLDGDTELAACIEPLPKVKDDDLERARREREKVALRHALATGGINARASELLAEIADSLGYWCRVLCEERGETYTPWRLRNRSTVLGQNHAEWLRWHLHSIAASESADEIAGDVDGHRGSIIALVNRPIRIMKLGECPTWDSERNATCGVDLHAPQDAVEVWCRRCRSTHNCHRLMLALMDAAEREVHPWAAILKINRNLPDDYKIAERTLQHWRTTGLLRPHQWQREDGRRGITQRGEKDVALYSWADVKRLQRRKPQKLKTGAAAHQS